MKFFFSVKFEVEKDVVLGILKKISIKNIIKLLKNILF